MSTVASPTEVHLSPREASSITLRLRVVARRATLTRQLADGESPAPSAQLRLRAQQLISPRSRSALANGLRHVVRDAQRPSWHHGFSIVSQRAVLGAVEEIDLLVKRLHSPEPVTPQGMALVAQLLTDGASSPLYGSGDPSVLRSRVILDTAALNSPDAVAAASV